MIDSYGVLNQNQSGSDLELAIESLQLLGYATLNSNNCMTFHAAGLDKSNAQKIGINHVYTSMIFRPQIDFNVAMENHVKGTLSEGERQVLGVDYPIPGGVEAFLSGRIRN